MEQKQDNAPFPGQKKGIIRVFLKRREHEGSVQLHFFKDNSDLEIVPIPKSTKRPKHRKKNKPIPNNSEQLSFDLYQCG